MGWDIAVSAIGQHIFIGDRMELIAEKLGKTDKLDRLRYVRADGSFTACSMPRQGILPHDLIHYVVESQLQLSNGFTGLIAQGAEAAFATQLSHGLAEKMAGAEAIQVEAMVEALQTQLWAGQFSMEDFVEGVRTACHARDQSTFDFSDTDIPPRLFEKVRELNMQWAAVPYYGSLTLQFPS